MTGEIRVVSCDRGGTVNTVTTGFCKVGGYVDHCSRCCD